MLKHKNYFNIIAANDSMLYAFSPGDEVIITCKIDGTNSSFQYSPENSDRVESFSRYHVLKIVYG